MLAPTASRTACFRLIAVVPPALVIAAALLAGGCAGTSPAIRTQVQPFTPAELELRRQAQTARYRLRVGDTFAVDFKYQDELDQKNITILPDGRFTMAGLEDVHAVGMTIPQLDSLITTHFGRDYNNPELSILVQELAKRQVYVLGEVRAPGIYDLPVGGEGVLQAVAMAGGFLPAASKGQVLLIRVTERGYFYRICNMSHLEKKGLRDASALDLQAFDVVYVPRSAIGDLAMFSETVLGSLVDIGNLFWDVYAITHLDKVQFLSP